MTRLGICAPLRLSSRDRYYEAGDDVGYIAAARVLGRTDAAGQRVVVAKAAITMIPIVFETNADPAAVELVENPSPEP